MLTPADIHNKEFRRGFRGYREDEVDDFLDEIVGDYERMTKQIAEMEGELALAVKKGAQYQDMEKQLQETLAVAQKTAEEVVKTARLRADEKLREAELECDRKRRQTESDCDGMRRKAEADIRRQYEAAVVKVKEQQALYEESVQHRRQLIVKMKSLLRSELELLDGELGEELAESKSDDMQSEAPAEQAAPEHEPEVGMPPDAPVDPVVPSSIGLGLEPTAARKPEAEQREIPVSEQDTATSYTGIRNRVQALLKMDERTLGTHRADRDEAQDGKTDAKAQK